MDSPARNVLNLGHISNGNNNNQLYINNRPELTELYRFILKNVTSGVDNSKYKCDMSIAL